MAKKETPKSGAQKVLNIILNVFIWLFVAFAVFMTILAFAAQANSSGVPTIFGRAFLSVQSDSMEPVIMTGDAIIGRTMTIEEAGDLEIGDVITYLADLNEDGTEELNTHRITQITEEDVAGVYYTTKGDNYASEDDFQIYPEDIICKWEGTKLPGVGKFMNFLQSPKGFLIVIVLPLLAFFIFELAKFIKTLVGIKNDGKKQITEADEELIRQRAIEEYKAQLEAQMKAQNGGSDEDAQQ